MRRLLATLGAFALLTEPVLAAPGVWGYQGLVTMPDGRIAQDRELEVGAHAITLANRPMAVAAFLRYGLFDAMEASLVYGVPGHPYLTGGLKYQLMRPTPQNPTSVALGTGLIGVPAGGPIAGTNYFLAVTREFGRWGSVHVGFEGDLALNSRVMVGMELPLLGIGRLMAEARGPQTGSGPHGSLGAELSPLPWVRVLGGTLGEPGDWLARSYYLGGSLHGVLPEYGRWFAAQGPSPTPAPRATPAPPRPSPGPTSTVQPPTLPAATVIGRVVGTDGVPKGGFTAVLVGSSKRAVTNNSGFFYFPGLLPGSYQLQILDRGGNPVATSTVQLGTEPVTVQIQVREGHPGAGQEKRGSVAGSVADAQSGEPLAEARLVIVGPGVSVLAVSKADGRFQVIDLPLGDYQVRAERKGYRSETASARVEAAMLHPVVRLPMTRQRP